MNRSYAARLILQMATFTQESDNDQPLSTQNIQDTLQPNTPALLHPNPLANDSSDTNSLPDSQPDLSLLEDKYFNIESVKTNKKMIVVEPSDSDSASSDSSTSSQSYADFSSDDSVKDPIFQPYNVVSSDSEGDVQPRLNKAHFNISPTPGPSHIKPQPLIFKNLPNDLDIQRPKIYSNPSSVNTKPLSIDSQPTSVDPQQFSRKRKAYPASWKRNKTKALRNSGKAYTSMSKSKKLIAARKMGPVCPGSCKLKCQIEFSTEERLAIYTNIIKLKSLFVCLNALISGTTGSN